ncbi:MAG: glutaredoxin family protein [Burkholderiaceae bacterium]
MTAHAQFKWREADGRVSYGDRLPDHPVTVLRSPAGWKLPGAKAAKTDAKSDPRLPYELRELSRRYPVLLYTTSNCEPCTQARAHLNKRGIPFNEKTVQSRRDVEAFNALGLPEGTGSARGHGGRRPADRLPVRTVGCAARQDGFRKESRLPGDFAQNPPQPLAANEPGQSQAVPREAASLRAALERQRQYLQEQASGAASAKDPDALRF